MTTFYARRYRTQRHPFTVPRYLLAILPAKGRIALMRALRAARNAFKCHIVLKKERANRFYAMCPGNSPLCEKHIESVNRLFAPIKDKKNPANPDPTPASKLPAATIELHLNQRAYDEASRLYNGSLTRYIKVYYWKWLEAKDAVERFMVQCDMAPAAKRKWFEWWNRRFLAQTMNWTTLLQDLLFPLWEDSVDELKNRIIERVEDPGHLLNTFYISSSWIP